MTVVRAPGYSPHAVAEHTLGLMLAAERDCGELRIYVTNTKTETKVELMAT
jgi:lactate dehydrogenase-like 2-hydroxyacid dehydrogenase